MSKYSLLCDNKKDSVKCANEIDKAIKAFGKQLTLIDLSYPDAGIGDTATDEQIIDAIYDYVHFEVKL